MHGLFDVDITEARRLLAADDPPLSLTAFVVASVARAAAAHPQVHAYRDWRGRLVEHRHVDVQTLIEVPTGQGRFGLVHIVRDADLRSVAEISAELRAVKTNPATTTTGRLLNTVAPTVGRIPGLYRAMYAAMSRSRRVHLATGTVQVTAVGMFADGGGFAIAPPTLASLVIVVGGLSKRPRAVGERVEVRDVLDLTVTDLGVAERGALLAAAVDRHDRGAQIERQRSCQVGRAGAGGPQPGQELAADRVLLPDVGPLVRPQPRPDRRRCAGVVEQRPGRAGTKHRGVIDAVPAREDRPDHGQGLAIAAGTVLGQLQPVVEQSRQIDSLHQHRRCKQPGVRDQIRLGEVHRHPAQVRRCSHPSDAPSYACRLFRRKTNPHR